MAQPLVGLKVQIVVEEDGTSNPPPLPEGTITKVFRNGNVGSYCVVRLDSPVKTLRAKTQSYWTLLNLLVAPRFKGDNCSMLVTHSKGLSTITVNIGHIANLEPDDPIVDLSSVVYFALGNISLAKQ